MLSERYLIMSLLGKGGFSEVFKVGFVGVHWRLAHEHYLLMSLLGKTGLSEVVMVSCGPSLPCRWCATGCLMPFAGEPEAGAQACHLCC